MITVFEQEINRRIKKDQEESDWEQLTKIIAINNLQIGSLNRISVLSIADCDKSKLRRYILGLLTRA